MHLGKLGKITLALAIVTSCFSSLVFAESYPNGLFAVNQMHFDATRSPHGFEWYLQSQEGQAIAAAAAASMGINPRYVTLAINALPTGRTEGEETFYELRVANGYAYCSSGIFVQSLVPAEGDHASVISASVWPGGKVGIYTWTPVRHSWEGGSWVEGDVQITGILPQYLNEFTQKGICAPIPAKIGLIECRGNPCSPGFHGISKHGEIARKEPRLVGGF